MATKEETERQVLTAIRENGATQPSFYGVVSFHFKGGKLTLVRREQTFYPTNPKEKNSQNANTHY